MRKTKKAAMVAIGLAASLTSVVALAAPASADTDIRGTESWDTNRLLMSLCTGNTGVHSWFFDTRTGAIRPDNIRADWQTRVSAPAWEEQFSGYCSYPQASSWTWAGPQTQISNLVMNCGYRVTQSEAITKSITKTSTTTNSVGGSISVEWGILKDVLSVEATASYQHTWSYSKATTWTQTDTLNVPPRTKAQLNFAPLMRTVRSNPVFHVGCGSSARPSPHCWSWQRAPVWSPGSRTAPPRANELRRWPGGLPRPRPTSASPIPGRPCCSASPPGGPPTSPSPVPRCSAPGRSESRTPSPIPEPIPTPAACSVRTAAR
ncbi:hypothetical protein ACGFZQ_28420 [Streptomyces sp. NPDC048254]|uniref:hypothetical protein n=1 Tax=Streptomyces sp. NPDC048254 TaxID=3365525 RepID=UPI003719047C